MTFWVLVGVLRAHLDDHRDSLKQGGILAARLAGQGDPRIQITRPVEGKLSVAGGTYRPVTATCYLLKDC